MKVVQFFNRTSILAVHDYDSLMDVLKEFSVHKRHFAVVKAVDKDTNPEVRLVVHCHCAVF